MATITTPMIAPHVERRWWWSVLLGCGIVASVWWVAMDVVGSLRYPGYSYIDQTISELGAEGAPTRTFMTLLSGIPYAVLMTAFGMGIWVTADGRRVQRITAAVLIGEVVWGFVGGLAFPMAPREVIAAGQETLRNQMHPWYGIGMPIFFVLAIGFGSRLFGKRFRSFSYGTILIMVVCGLLVGLQTSALTANQPTPWLGVEERINAYASMLWFAVLAVGLLRAQRTIAPRQLEKPPVIQQRTISCRAEAGAEPIPVGGQKDGNIMKTLLAFIKRHPVLSYFTLTFAISWGGMFLVIGGPRAIQSTGEQVELLWPLALLATFAGPPTASILMIGLIAGRAGLRDLLSRLLRWRVGARWYAVALVTAPVLVTAILLALSLTPPEYIPGIITTSNKASLVLFGITWALIGGGLLEELGWTGFAVPALRQRHNTLTTALIVGLLWGVWHVPITFWIMSGSTFGGLSLAAFLPMFVFFHFGALPAYRVLLVWIHDRTTSLLVVMLMHASYSASRLILNPLTITGMALATYDLVSAAVLWIVVAAVAAINRGQPTRQSLSKGVA